MMLELIASVMRESIFSLAKFYSCPDVKFFDNLIGWTLANTGNAMLE